MNPLYAFFLTLFLVYRAHSRKSLTPAGILTAALTAAVHSLHPSSLPFALLLVFYLLGTTATKVKKEKKESLVLQSDGGHAHIDTGDKKASSSPSSSTRGTIQVLSNSGVASLLCLIDFLLRFYPVPTLLPISTPKFHELLLLGIISNYSCTTSDTLSSELGILSPTPPYLITSVLRFRPTTCPPGTNGGISLIGLLAGTTGSFIIALISSIHFSNPIRFRLVLFTTTIGLLGTLLDSVLGALFQPTILDTRTGKVIENPHGGVVLVNPGSVAGRNILHQHAELERTKARDDDAPQKSKEETTKNREASRKVFAHGGGRTGIKLTNNEVNVLTAMSMGFLGMVGWYFIYEGVAEFV